MSNLSTIAIDVDDTLADHAEAFVAWSNEKYGTLLTVEDYHDHWSLLWSVDHDETARRAEIFHQTGAHRRFVVKADSVEVLRRLSKRYRLVVVTARRQLVVQDSLEWIQEYYEGIFSDVRFVPIWEADNTVTKADICRELGAQYLIDDLMRHCSLAAEAGITALLFGDYAWNRHEQLPPDITRVRDWKAVEEFFDGRNDV